MLEPRIWFVVRIGVRRRSGLTNLQSLLGVGVRLLLRNLIALTGTSILVKTSLTVSRAATVAALRVTGRAVLAGTVETYWASVIKLIR